MILLWLGTFLVLLGTSTFRYWSDILRLKAQIETSIQNRWQSFLKRFVLNLDKATVKDIRKRAMTEAPKMMPGQPGLIAQVFETVAYMLVIRCEQNWDREEIDDAIKYLRKALALRPRGQFDHLKDLVELAIALRQRFKIVGDRADLGQAIVYGQKALKLAPPGHKSRSYCLAGLANAFLIRYEHFGDRGDVDQAITHGQSALELQQPGHPNRPGTLVLLANILRIRFQLVGDWADLDQALLYYQSALEMTPPGHPDRFFSLMNLGVAQTIRFDYVGDQNDLDQAILYYESALELTLPGHPARSSSLTNLAQALRRRGERIKDRSVMDQAIVHYREALGLTPPGHPWRSLSLANLANALLMRAQEFRDYNDLDQAISYQASALELNPPGHPDRAARLLNLANELLLRYEQFGNRGDLDQATICHQSSLELYPPGHPGRSQALVGFARALEIRYARATPQDRMNSTEISGLQKCLQFLQEASSVTMGVPSQLSLHASLYWIDFAVKWNHRSCLAAYRTALELLETVLSTGQSLESRHARITSGNAGITRNLAVDGAACALDMGLVHVAVELLEQGRSVLLTQAGKYRTSVDEIRTVDPSLADEFASISRLMEKSVISAGAQEVESLSILGPGDAIARYQTLSHRWTATIDRIRSLKHFESFLRPTPFSVLRTAAAHGPVILVNISVRRSDAIVIRALEEPLVVRLPKATPQALAQLSENANASTPAMEFDRVLKGVWEKVVQPVTLALQNEVGLAKGSRIWWCPTGAASRLPLHAAGIYNKRGQTLPDIYISSYTSTLTTLIRARKSVQNQSAPAINPSLLIVGQGKTKGQTALPSVGWEIDEILPIVPRATVMSGSHGTREAVLKEMEQHAWTHIACHGHLDQNHPFRSHFSVQDGSITLLDIAGQNLPNAELAFLAACHSAEGNMDRPDEVLHLTAGLQFAGVRCVVGTLWAMCDEDGPIIARAFYSNLLGGRGTTSSAFGLHRLLGCIRQSENSESRGLASRVHDGLVSSITDPSQGLSSCSCTACICRSK